MTSRDELMADQDSQISAQIGQYLSSQYGVLVKVLQCLTARDLKNASKVCRSWESAARKILAAETKLKWLFYRRDRGWNVAPQLATWSAMCEHVYFDPDICLCFITKKCFSEKLQCNSSDVPCPLLGDTPCQKTHLFSDYLASFLGPSCRFLVFPVSGVVSTDQDLSRTWEVDYYESREKGSSAMSTIFFPKMKGVTIITFSLDLKKQASLAEANGKNVDIVKLLGLPEDEVVQAVLIFCAGSVNQRCTSILVSKLQERQHHRIAAGGAIVEGHCFEGMVFCGPNVCAASIVLTENVCEKEQVEEKLTTLKECCLPTENTMAFMFACLARGCAWYDDEPNVESEIIMKTFPKTPVVGFFGSGEMGVRCLPDFSEPMRNGSRQFWKFWKEVSRLDGKFDDAAAGTSAGSADGEPPRKIKNVSKKQNRNEFSDINYSYSTSIVLLSFNTAS